VIAFKQYMLLYLYTIIQQLLQICGVHTVAVARDLVLQLPAIARASVVQALAIATGVFHPRIAILTGLFHRAL